MTEEIKKNTVATVGMWFSIIGLILLITVFLAWFWLPLLLIWLILWIIGLFSKPRVRARIAVIIPLVVFVVLTCVACYFWKSVKTPANEFMDWVNPQLEQLESEDFNGDVFGDLLEAELNNITNNTSEEERKSLFEASTGSNFLEKGSYLFFSVIRQGFESALEKYNDGELPGISDEDNNIISVDVDVDDESDEDNNEENDSEENESGEQEEVTVVQPKQTSNGTFSQSEKNDIEQVLDILE